jgi:hypothetical protein
MNKALTAVAAAATVAFLTIAAPSPAEARCRGCVVGGILGGFALGAIVGSALAGPPPPPVYVAPAPPVVVAGPRCWREPRGPSYWDGGRWIQPTVRVCQ